jgi:hypothetical protein
MEIFIIFSAAEPVDHPHINKRKPPFPRKNVISVYPQVCEKFIKNNQEYVKNALKKAQ